MLRHVLRCCLLIGFLVVMSTVTRAERGNSTVQLDGKSIDTMIGEFMQEHDIPGMTLAIVQAPYISRVVGYGVSDPEKRLLASPKTIWNVGQMTQAYTAVAIMQLVEAGKLSIDDPVGKHLPKVPEAWRTIPLKYLMAHASGLPDYSQQPAFQPTAEYRPEEVIALLKDVRLSHPPGTQVANSATDFFLLRLIIEQASGTTYEDYITRHQIERLGLKNTCFASGLAERQTELESTDGKHRKFLTERRYIDPTEAAAGSVMKDGKPVVVPANSQSGPLANGAIWTSAEDISLWDVGLVGNMLINNKENREFLFRPAQLGDGTTAPSHCGWRFLGHKGAMDIRGNVPGFSCHLSRFTDPSELLCVTLCCNKGGVELSELARRIAGAFDSKIAPPVSTKLMKCMESAYSVKTTMARLVAAFHAQEIRLLSRYSPNTTATETARLAADFQAQRIEGAEPIPRNTPAIKTASELPVAWHLVFGKTDAQTHSEIGIPTRILVWQEPSGEVWLGTPHAAEPAAFSESNDEGKAIPQIDQTEAAMAFAAGACQ